MPGYYLRQSGESVFLTRAPESATSYDLFLTGDIAKIPDAEVLRDPNGANAITGIRLKGPTERTIGSKDDHALIWARGIGNNQFLAIPDNEITVDDSFKDQFYTLWGRAPKVDTNGAASNASRWTGFANWYLIGDTQNEWRPLRVLVTRSVSGVTGYQNAFYDYAARFPAMADGRVQITASIQNTTTPYYTAVVADSVAYSGITPPKLTIIVSGTGKQANPTEKITDLVMDTPYNQPNISMVVGEVISFQGKGHFEPIGAVGVPSLTSTDAAIVAVQPDRLSFKAISPGTATINGHVTNKASNAAEHSWSVTVVSAAANMPDLSHFDTTPVHAVAGEANARLEPKVGTQAEIYIVLDSVNLEKLRQALQIGAVQIAWTTGDSTIATVMSQDGLKAIITTLKAGGTAITATVTDSGGQQLATAFSHLQVT